MGKKRLVMIGIKRKGEKGFTVKTNKGGKNGTCKRAVCNNKPANYFNHSTLKYYCSQCADLINTENAVDSMRMFGHELCTKR